MLRAAVQRNFPKADVHAGLNTIDRNRSFAADAPQVRVADKTALCKCSRCPGRDRDSDSAVQHNPPEAAIRRTL